MEISTEIPAINANTYLVHQTGETKYTTEPKKKRRLIGSKNKPKMENRQEAKGVSSSLNSYVRNTTKNDKSVTATAVIPGLNIVNHTVGGSGNV